MHKPFFFIVSPPVMAHFANSVLPAFGKECFLVTLRTKQSIYIPMTITLAFDSFKGSLTSEEVAQAFQEGLHSVQPHCSVRKAYIADGGEGTANALMHTLEGTWVETEVQDPLGRPISAQYGIIDDGHTAIIEMASASGLTLLKEDERNPLKTSTYGTGQLIAHAIKGGCTRFLVGIGGSSTNDGGTGMLCALGFRFLDKERKELVGGGEILERIASIDDSHVLPDIQETEFIVACDVANPLYGPEGAAYVFAPQKGADAGMVGRLDMGLRNFAEAIRHFCGKDVSSIPGAGAAGGMGAGLMALLNAKLTRGIDMVLDAMNFEDMVRGSDLVITGEGCIDRQTIMGKAPSGILRIASSQGIPTIAIGGCIKWCKELEESGFTKIICTNEDNVPKELAMQHDIAFNRVRQTGKIIGEQLHTIGLHT